MYINYLYTRPVCPGYFNLSIGTGGGGNPAYWKLIFQHDDAGHY